MRFNGRKYIEITFGSHTIPFYVVLIFSAVVAVVLQARLLDIKSYWTHQILEVAVSDAERNFHNQFNQVSDYIEMINAQILSQDKDVTVAELNSIFENSNPQMSFIRAVEIDCPQNFNYSLTTFNVDSNLTYKSKFVESDTKDSTVKKAEIGKSVEVPEIWADMFYNSKRTVDLWSDIDSNNSTISFDYFSSGKESATHFKFHIYKNYLANFMMDLFYEIHKSNLTKGLVRNNKSLFFIHTRKELIWLEIDRNNSFISYKTGHDDIQQLGNEIAIKYYNKWINGVKLLNKPIVFNVNDSTYWGISKPLYFNKQIPFYIGIATLENSLIPYFHSTTNYLFYTYAVLSILGLLLSVAYAIKYYQHRKAQKLIQINEERLRISLENSNEGVFDIEFNGSDINDIITSHYSLQNNRILGIEIGHKLTLDKWVQRIHPYDCKSSNECLLGIDKIKS